MARVCRQVRFARDEIYTFVGSVLLAVNPYKSIPSLYGDETMATFEYVRPRIAKRACARYSLELDLCLFFVPVALAIGRAVPTTPPSPSASIAAPPRLTCLPERLAYP